jgi:subtilisin family serine protease
MKRHLKPLWAAIAAAVLGITSPSASSQWASVPLEAAEGGTLWFVELAGAPVADGASASAVRAEKAAFRRNAAASGLRMVERRSYDTLFNGLVVKVELRDRSKLLQLPGVKAIHPVTTVQAPTPEQAAGSAVDLAAALGLTGANIAQNTRGLTGRGIKVGIIDTGIDIDHPAFGGSGTNGTTPFPTARVVAGHDFVGDNYDAGGTGAQLVPVPDANPDDCNGHGTHVAGIVGANGGGIVGVAPGVTFGAYRVFGCVGSTDSDIILAAMEQAHADGMDIINQSLGAARQWPQYPTAQAASRLVKLGVVMVASIGNNGPGGSSPDALFAAGAPGVGDRVIGVASFDNAQRAFSVNGTPYGYTPASAAPLPPTSGSLPMARTGTAASTADACTALPAGSLTGHAALIRRGGCTFYAKAFNAQSAGATAVVLHNNAPGALNATVAGAPPRGPFSLLRRHMRWAPPAGGRERPAAHHTQAPWRLPW